MQATAPPTLPQLPKVDGNTLMPFLAVNAWVKAATHCRFDITPLFHAAGVDFQAGRIPTIRKAALVQLMQQCVVRAAPHYHFPVILGEYFAFDHLPALETFLATSPTLRQAVPALHWANIVMPTMSLKLEENGATSALLLEVDLPGASNEVKGYFVESVLASISKVVRLALGPTHLIHHIEVRHQPSPLFLATLPGFIAPIRTGQARDAGVFASRLLDTPLPGASPGLHEQAQAVLEQELAEPSAQLLHEQVTRMLRQQPALLAQGLDEVASQLGLHPRTLQRRLQDTGHAFASILSACRQQLASEALMGTRCDMEALSARLGFADRHSFTRAFKRWTGVSPTAWRRQQRATPPQ
jgi:AraC-like DNA-binding protein